MRWLNLVCAASLLAACAEDVHVPVPSAAPGAVMAEVVIEPVVGPPGRLLRITARVPAATEAALTLSLGGGTPVNMPAPTPDGGFLVSTVEVSALPRTGDQLVRIAGDSDAGPVAGFGLYEASKTLQCAVGEVSEAGRCLTPEEERHTLSLTSVATIGTAHGPEVDERNMQHPRAVYRVGSAVVACNTDNIGIVHLQDMEQIQELLHEDAGDPDLAEDEDDDGFTPVTETLLIEAGLHHCENLVLTADQRIAISSSRGTFGRPGGLATWRIGDLSAPPYDPPELLDTVVDDDGFEGIVLKGDVLLAARKPNRLASFRVEADGKLTLLSDVVIPDLLSAWNVALDGDLLFLTDPGKRSSAPIVSDGPGDTNHFGHPHGGTGGRVYTIDVTDPSDPQPLGFADTRGAAKGVTVLPDRRIAVANGAAGIQLFDVSNPQDPMGIAEVQTPSTVNGVAYGGGYLLAADWNSVRLYDVTEHDAPRFIEGTDMGILAVLEARWEAEALAEEGPDAEFQALSGSIALGYVSLSEDGEWLATDLDRIFVGRLTPGGRAPRLGLHDTRLSVRVGPDAKAQDERVIKISNDSRSPLWARIRETDRIASPTGTVVIAPGDEAALEVHLLDLSAPGPPDRVFIESADPETPERMVRLLAIENQYEIGDLAPPFAMAAVNWCDGEEECDPEQLRCFDTRDPLFANKPMFFALFSSW